MKILMEKLPNENFVYEYKNDLVDSLLTEDNYILFDIFNLFIGIIKYLQLCSKLIY